MIGRTFSTNPPIPVLPALRPLYFATMETGRVKIEKEKNPLIVLFSQSQEAV